MLCCAEQNLIFSFTYVNSSTYKGLLPVNVHSRKTSVPIKESVRNRTEKIVTFTCLYCVPKVIAIKLSCSSKMWMYIYPPMISKAKYLVARRDNMKRDLLYIRSLACNENPVLKTLKKKKREPTKVSDRFLRIIQLVRKIGKMRDNKRGKPSVRFQVWTGITQRKMFQRLPMGLRVCI